jgi:hypothetical protein
MVNPSSNSPLLPMNPESLNEMSRNYWNSAILGAAIKLDIFTLLEPKEQNSAGLSHADLVQRVGADERFLHAFLGACAALGLVELQHGIYRNSPAASSFLIKGKEQYVGDLVLHNESLGGVGPVGPAGHGRKDLAPV